MPTRTRTIPSRNYAPAERTVDFPTVVENNFNQCKISFLRESWPLTTADTVLTVIAESSPVPWSITMCSTFRSHYLPPLRNGDAMERIEKLIRNAVRQALRANIGATQIMAWVWEELVNEVDGGRKRAA